jgi:hypothetical protein
MAIALRNVPQSGHGAWLPIYGQGASKWSNRFSEVCANKRMFVRTSCMNVLAVISPGLKVLVERVGKPEIVNRPNLFRSGGAGPVIACNHVGWADGLWMAYAVYPRQLRYMSKEELFDSTLSRLVLTHGGSLPINRADPSPSSIKTAVDMLQRRNHPDLPERHAKRGKYRLQARRCDYRTSRPGSTCARLLSRPEADASRASPAPTSHTGDIRITDPNSGAAVWEGNDD